MSNYGSKMDGGNVRNHSKNKMSTKTLNYSLFSPKSKPKKSRFRSKNEKVRRVAKKPKTDPTNLMKERFQRMKSLSPMQRILITHIESYPAYYIASRITRILVKFAIRLF